MFDQFVGHLGQCLGGRLWISGWIFAIAALHGIENGRLGPEGQAGQGGSPHIIGSIRFGGVASEPFRVLRTTHAEICIDGAPDQRLTFQIGTIKRLGQGRQGIRDGEIVMNRPCCLRDEIQVVILEEGGDPRMRVPAKSKYGSESDGGVTGLRCIKKRLSVRLGRSHEAHDRSMSKKGILVVIFSEQSEEWFNGCSDVQFT